MVNQIYDRTMYPTSCAAGLLPLALAALSLCVKRQPRHEAIRVSKSVIRTTKWEDYSKWANE
jgi:hypothetical protein